MRFKEDVFQTQAVLKVMHVGVRQVETVSDVVTVIFAMMEEILTLFLPQVIN